MKLGKKYTCLIIIALFAAINIPAVNNCRAQDQQKITGEKLKAMTPQQRADLQTDIMLDKLKLGNQQLVQVKALNLKYALKFQPIIESKDSRFSKYRQAKKLLEQKDLELKDVFTTSQYKQYKDFEDDMRKKIQEKMKD